MSGQATPRAPRSGKTAQKARKPTRERLVDAVFAVVRRDGLAQLTAVALTTEAGIAQPRFYRYFDNLDACLAEAAERMAAGFSEVTVALRRQMRDPRDLGELATHYGAVLTIALQQRPFVELALRTAHDPTVLGEVWRRTDAQARQTFADELFERAARAGLCEQDRPAVRGLADLILDSAHGGITRLLALPPRDAEAAVPALARELAVFTSAGTAAIFGELLPRPPRVRRRRTR